MSQFKTILCPIDFSQPSLEALRMACSLARDYSAKIVLLHVKPREPNPSGVMSMPPEPPEARLELQQRLDSVSVADPSLTVERYLVVGDVATDILRIAAEKQCDLIVMSTHGRSGLSRLLMGSVAESVLRQAPCAVLTVRSATKST